MSFIFPVSFKIFISNNIIPNTISKKNKYDPKISLLWSPNKSYIMSQIRASISMELVAIKI